MRLRPAFRLVWLVGVALIAAAATSAAADYPDRNIDMIVPYGAGGGFDTYARAVGRMLEKHAGKGVKVIPRNMPGAGSKRGTTALYHAPADGYTVGILDLPGAAVPQILGEPVNYDLDKITWLGVVNVGVYSIVSAGNSAFKTFDAFRNLGRQVFFATTGSNDYAMARIMVDALKLNAKFITGYNSAPEAHLAVMRGEADASLGIDVTVNPRIRAGEMRRLAVLRAGEPDEAEQNVPTATGLGHPELANLELYRLFAAPPDLPVEIRRRLNELMQQSLNDPELVAWGKTANFPVTPGPAETAATFYKEQRAFLTRYRELLK